MKVRISEHLRPAVPRHPLRGRPRLAVLAVYEDVLAKADDVVETQDVEMAVSPLATETAIGHDRDPDPLVEQLVETLDDLVLVHTLSVLQLALAHRLPDERRCSAVPGQEVEGDGRLAVLVELGPVQRDPQRIAFPDHERDPACEEDPHGGTGRGRGER
jgi:hypothetical protein